MVLIPLLVASFTIVWQQNNASILSKLVPNPTGHNGYEEYLRAADLLGTSGWTIYENWIAYRQRVSTRKSPMIEDEENLPELPPGVSADMPELLIRKVADDRLSGAYDIVRIGNEKNVYDPRTEFRYDTLLPEFSRFRSLAKLGTNRAYVEFADGRTRLAVEDLLAGMKFSSKIFGISRISALVANSVQAVDLAAFEDHLSQLSYSDCQQIEKACSGLIGTPPDVSTIFRGERSLSKSSLEDVFEKSGEMLPTEDYEAFGPALKELSIGDRQQLRSMVEPVLENRWTEEEQRLSGPESGWLMRDGSDDLQPSANDKSVSNLAVMLVQDILPKSMQRQFAKALARGRIQLRLLRLHAKVLEYHWLNNRWPTKIEEFADAKTAQDPFEGAPFHYELKGAGYRIYSQGIPGLGPIELKYKPLTAPTSSNGSPPPSR